MIILNPNRILKAIQQAAWILFLVFLPLTAFPFFPTGFGGGTLVRPLSFYPLLILLVVITFPRMLAKPLPKPVIALFPFLLISCASSALSLLSIVEPSLGVTVLDRTLRGLITLGAGAAMYITVSLYPRSPDELNAALRYIYAGFSLAMLWGSMQILYVLDYSPAYFQTISQIQRLFSIRKLFETRISGLTYEPNWYAEQISILLLPWLIAALIQGYSVFRWRWRFFTVEWLLLAWALINLGFTFSRAGFLNLIVLAIFGLILFRVNKSQSKTTTDHPTGWIKRLLEIFALLIVVVGMIYVIGRNNTFFSRMWNYWSVKKDTSLESYIEYIGFGARTAYLETALHIYQAYPILGVGVSNYAFYFDEMFPDRPLAPMPELVRILTPEAGRDRLITPKNLYARTLAETGLIGMAAFIAFLLSICGCALYLWLSPNPAFKYWGIAGLLAFLVVLVSANSYDSYAIPNLWVSLGLISAAANIYDRFSLNITEF